MSHDSDWRQQADLQFLDAALIQAHEDSGAASEARIVGVLKALDDQPARVAPRSWRLVRWGAPLATAAAVLVMATAVWFPKQAESAMATVERAISAALVPQDRTYRVRIQPAGAASSNTPLEATLYLRGGERFVVRHPGIVSGEMWLGTNGRKLWFVPAIGPVLEGDRLGLLPQWHDEAGVALPYLQLATILRRLQDRYELEEVPTSESVRQHIRGRRVSADAGWPATIDLWVDRDTGVAEELTLDWPEATVGARRVQFQLTSQAPLGDNWYDHTAHHAADRKVFHSDGGGANKEESKHVE